MLQPYDNADAWGLSLDPDFHVKIRGLFQVEGRFWYVMLHPNCSIGTGSALPVGQIREHLKIFYFARYSFNHHDKLNQTLRGQRHDQAAALILTKTGGRSRRSSRRGMTGVVAVV